MDLANKVRVRREELGWSQEELAKRMGYSSRTSINKIENGRPCSQKIIARLAESLNVPIAYLMDWEVTEETKKDNERLAKLIVRMRTDKTFFSLIDTLYDFDEAQITSVSEMVKALQTFKQ